MLCTNRGRLLEKQTSSMLAAIAAYDYTQIKDHKHRTS